MTWINRAVALLDQSLGGVEGELNELDWKERISSDKKRLADHIMAMSNL